MLLISILFCSTNRSAPFGSCISMFGASFRSAQVPKLLCHQHLQTPSLKTVKLHQTTKFRMTSNDGIKLATSRCETRKLWSKVCSVYNLFLNSLVVSGKKVVRKVISKEGSISFLLVSVILPGCKVGICNFVLRVGCAKRRV